MDQESEQILFEEERKRLVESFDTSFRPKKSYILVGFFLCVLSVYLLIKILLSAPSSFPSKTSITLERGASLQSLARELKEKDIIKSETLFQFFVIMFGGEKRIAPGEYYFETPVPVYTVAYRIGEHLFGIQKIKVTIPEGVSNKEMASILQKKLSGFDGQAFLNATKDKEGYLFPDTYFFFPNTTTDEIIRTLEDTFKRRTQKVFSEQSNSTLSSKEIIILASILEKEARGKDELRVVSGILQARLEKGMPLQVDAPFLYLIGKGSSELTLSDLRADGPYNTYTRKGLIPTPIGNPGIDAIEAVLYPTSSSYLFYLHGNDGVIRYARTFTEHKKNKSLYLR